MKAKCIEICVKHNLRRTYLLKRNEDSKILLTALRKYHKINAKIVYRDCFPDDAVGWELKDIWRDLQMFYYKIFQILKSESSSNNLLITH